MGAARYDAAGRLIHEEYARDGERLDAYLARVCAEDGDAAYWTAMCQENRVEVRDYFSLRDGTFTRERWYVRWYDGARWRSVDLQPGERPRMRHGYCHVVNEG